MRILLPAPKHFVAPKAKVARTTFDDAHQSFWRQYHLEGSWW